MVPPEQLQIKQRRRWALSPYEGGKRRAVHNWRPGNVLPSYAACVRAGMSAGSAGRPVAAAQVSPPVWEAGVRAEGVLSSPMVNGL